MATWKLLDGWNKVWWELHRERVHGHCWAWPSGQIMESEFIMKLYLLVPWQWKVNWALKLDSFRFGNQTGCAGTVVIVKIFPDTWAILYVLQLNLTRLCTINVTSDFKVLFKKGNCFDFQINWYWCWVCVSLLMFLLV